LCDRGEYLSAAHKMTAIERLPMTSYTPPYRGDLKGSVEVLHRIAKDAQFLFIPGAMDFRRKELELRRVDPKKSVFTLREYVSYLYEVFTHYNLTANRESRVDAYMTASGVDPTPAGLWRWGHEAGIGFRRATDPSDLISDLLPADTASVRQDAVRFFQCDYTSPEVQTLEWTTSARNLGSWRIPAHYYPGSMAHIWTPHPSGTEMMQLSISDQARAALDMSTDEWADVRALSCVQRSGQQDARNRYAVQAVQRMEELKNVAERLTRQAIKEATQSPPNMSEARAMELEARPYTCAEQTKEEVETQIALADEHDEQMIRILQGHN
jgi:putative transposase